MSEAVNASDSVTYHFRHKSVVEALQLAADYLKTRDEIKYEFIIDVNEGVKEWVVSVHVTRI